MPAPDTVFDGPNVLTTVQQPGISPAELRQHGYASISFQAWNGGPRGPFDLGPWQAAGLNAGVWGVTYDRHEFAADAAGLVERAHALGAQHQMIDAEAVLDNISEAELKPLLDGLDAYAGPKALTTQGAPANEENSANDYRIHPDLWLARGYHLFSQDYANANDSQTPALGMHYWKRVGYPAGALSSMISLSAADKDQQYPGRRFSGAQWVPLLGEAGVTRNFSIFLAEFATPSDWVALDALTRLPVPGIPVALRDHARQDLKQAIAIYESQGTPYRSTRVQHGDWVLNATDEQRRKADAALRPIFKP